MQVKKRNTMQGDWARVKEDIFNGDIISILNEGKVVEGEYGDRNVFTIKTKNGEKSLSFNQTTMNYVIDAYGVETKDWIGKEVKVWMVKSNIKGKIIDVVYLTAPDWIETNDGFGPAGKQDEDIPVIDDSNEEYEG